MQAWVKLGRYYLGGDWGRWALLEHGVRRDIV